MKKVICKYCQKEYSVIPSRASKTSYCSLICYRQSGAFKNSGRTRFKKGENTNENNHEWKGEGASYSAIHHWVKRKRGRPAGCGMCGSKDDRKYQWANISGQYKRDLEDYRSLCIPCHKKYDLERIYYGRI